tara:strand:+ start:43 stop:312 length:270 start_codon:yes stop_codon:yes gene_type:complete
MIFYVYLIINLDKKPFYTYVGYTNNLKKRMNLHNTSLGAKFTRGRSWKLIYKKKYKTKIKAMQYEYKLKNCKKKRNYIKKKYLIANNYI